MNPLAIASVAPLMEYTENDRISPKNGVASLPAAEELSHHSPLTDQDRGALLVYIDLLTWGSLKPNCLAYNSTISLLSRKAA